MESSNALARFTEGRNFQAFILVLIGLNAIVLALEAVPSAKSYFGDTLTQIDTIILWIFVAEIVLRLIAFGPAFFRDPWNIFDFSVVAVSFLSTAGLSALRAFRVFRVLRVLSAVPRLRMVVRALLEALPGVMWVGLLLLVILFVSAVIATHLFGHKFPEQFGNLFISMFTLFQVMTLEGWPDLANSVLKEIPYAWIFFVVYILVATLTMLNLFVAIIVSAMENETAESGVTNESIDVLTGEIRVLRQQVELLEKRLK
ncbi:MAG: ion transporter [Desulfobulbia bacterium]